MSLDDLKMDIVNQNAILHRWLHTEWNGTHDTRYRENDQDRYCCLCGADEYRDGFDEPCPGPDYDAPEMEGVLRRAVTKHGAGVEWLRDGTVWVDNGYPESYAKTLPLATIAAFGLL